MVERSTLRGDPNSITQVISAGRNITRNYYGADGKQTKQITNGNHGNAKRHPFGVNGEHAHDYIWEDGRLDRRSVQELTKDERKENADIL